MAPRKKQHLVETALKLFTAEGYHGVGIDRILAVAGVAKMTLYNNFASKDDLIAAALEHHHHQFLDWFDDRLNELTRRDNQRALAAFDILAEWFDAPDFHGCPMVKVSAEYRDPDHPFRQAALAFKRALFERLRDDAAAAGAKKPAVLAGELLMLFEGAIVIAQITGDVSAAPRARQAADRLIKAARRG